MSDTTDWTIVVAHVLAAVPPTLAAILAYLKSERAASASQQAAETAQVVHTIVNNQRALMLEKIEQLEKLLSLERQGHKTS